MSLVNPAVAMGANSRAGKSSDPCVRGCVRDMRRELVVVTGLPLAVWLGLVLLIQFISGSSSLFPAVIHAAALVIAAFCLFGLTILLARRRLIPAQEMQLWQADRTANDFLGIDGNREVPKSPEEILVRLTDKTGPEVLFFRIGALAQLGQTEQAMAALEAWRPNNPLDQCRRERLASRVDRESGQAHLRLAEDALSGIADPARKAAQRALLLLDTARFNRDTMWAGLSALAAARAELGPYYRLSQPPKKSPAYRQWSSAAGGGLTFGALSLWTIELSTLTWATFFVAMGLAYVVVPAVLRKRFA